MAIVAPPAEAPTASGARLSGTLVGVTTRLRRAAAGIRPRILGWYVLLLVLAIVASVLLERKVLLDRLDSRIDDQLAHEAEELRRLADAPGRVASPGGGAQAVFDEFLARNSPGDGMAYYTFVDGAPSATSPGVPAALHQDDALVRRWVSLRTPARGALDTEAGPARWLAVPLLDEGRVEGTFVVAAFSAAEREDIDSAISVAATVSLSVLFVISLLAWAVAGRVIAPVRAVTDTARSISESDLSGRIPVRGNDEVAELATTFNAMLDRLESAFASQRNFVNDAGHELRTPITVIRSQLDVLGDDPDERRETLALVDGELDRMTRMVDDLLLLAKAERPGFLQVAETDVAHLLREVHAKASLLGERSWLLQVPEGVRAVVDEQRITQALMNLAENAVRHTRDGDIIAIGAAVKGPELRAWVRDTGLGVDPADAERIFERFARGRNARRASSGAGLGLAIVRSIAEAHGGRVELRTVAGAGATFTLVLPRVVVKGREDR